MWVDRSKPFRKWRIWNDHVPFYGMALKNSSNLICWHYWLCVVIDGNLNHTWTTKQWHGFHYWLCVFIYGNMKQTCAIKQCHRYDKGISLSKGNHSWRQKIYMAWLLECSWMLWRFLFMLELRGILVLINTSFIEDTLSPKNTMRTMGW